MGRRFGVPVLTLVVVAGIFLPTAARASETATPPDLESILPDVVAGPISADAARIVGPDARPTENGFRVPLANGRSLYTHGPDAKAGSRGGARVVGAFGDQRDPVCATDNYQHLLYAYPAGGTNASATAIPAIRTVFKQLNNFLYETSLATSGSTIGSDYKVKCNANNEIQVDTFTVPAGQVGFQQVASAAASAGFSDQAVDYSIFFDSPASQSCGVGSFYGDERLIANNLNNNPTGVGSGYAVTYGGPSRFGTNNDCWQTTTPMHENGHNQGAVQGVDPASPNNPDGSAMVGSPNNTGDGSHCTDGLDVMCYADGGSNESCGDFLCSGTCTVEEWDCGNDDYFDALPESGEYLETHWNIGSDLNRFIVRCTGTCVRMSRATLSIGEETATVNLTIQRYGAAAAFDVTLNTNDGTAIAPNDFTDVATDTLVSFTTSDVTKTVPVTIVRDALKETNETFTAVLSAPTNGVVLGIDSQTITIRASDQQPDGYIKLAGGAYRGMNIYNTSTTGQNILTSARRGQTRTFYVVVQNDGQVRNLLRYRGTNTSGTTIVVNRSSSVTRSFRSSSGIAKWLNPGQSVTLRIDFKMLSSAGGIEDFKMLAWWSGDRVVKDMVMGRVRV